MDCRSPQRVRAEISSRTIAQRARGRRIARRSIQSRILRQRPNSGDFCPFARILALHAHSGAPRGTRGGVASSRSESLLPRGAPSRCTASRPYRRASNPDPSYEADPPRLSPRSPVLGSCRVRAARQGQLAGHATEQPDPSVGLQPRQRHGLRGQPDHAQHRGRDPGRRRSAHHLVLRRRLARLRDEQARQHSARGQRDHGLPRRFPARHGQRDQHRDARGANHLVGRGRGALRRRHGAERQVLRGGRHAFGDAALLRRVDLGAGRGPRLPQRPVVHPGRHDDGRCGRQPRRHGGPGQPARLLHLVGQLEARHHAPQVAVPVGRVCAAQRARRADGRFRRSQDQHRRLRLRSGVQPDPRAHHPEPRRAALPRGCGDLAGWHARLGAARAAQHQP